MFQWLWTKYSNDSIIASTIKMFSSKYTAQCSIHLDVHPFAQLAVFIIHEQMSIRRKCKNLFFLPWLPTISYTLDADKNLDFNFSEISALALHDTFSSITSSLSDCLLDSTLLIKVPILEMLVACSNKKWIQARESKSIDWLAKFVRGHSLLSSPVPDEEASVIRIS